MRPIAMIVARPRRLAFVIVALLMVAGPIGSGAQTFRDQEPEWVLQIGGPNNDVSSRQIVIDRNGDVIVCGTFTGSIQIGSNTYTSMTQEQSDAFVTKVSPSGTVVWTTIIAGAETERIREHRIDVDSRNHILLMFTSNSSQVRIGSEDLVLHAPSLERPRLIELSEEGRLVWSIRDSLMLDWGEGDAEWAQLDCNNDGRLVVATSGWCRGSQLRQYTVQNGRYTEEEVLSFPNDSGANCDQYRIQSVLAESNQSIVYALGFDGRITVDDSTYEGGNDVLLIRKGLFRTEWIHHIRGLGRSTERVFGIVRRSNEIVVLGEFGMVSDSLYTTDSVDFGGRKLARSSENNAFIARYNFQSGQLLDVRQLNCSLSAAIGEFTSSGDTVMVSTPGGGFYELTGSSRESYHQDATYSLTPVCGGNIVVGQFTDTLELGDKSSPTVSRGGSDVYVALMKSKDWTYFPPAPTVKYPLWTRPLVDVPVAFRWWSVPCATRYQLQVSASRTLSDLVVDTMFLAVDSIILDGLNFSTKYFWRLRAITDITIGAWSNVREFATIQPEPEIVRLRTPISGARGRMRVEKLTWDSSYRATSYVLDVATDRDFLTKVVDSLSVSSTSAFVTLPANRTCYWRVKALNAFGASPWSEVWDFETRPDSPARVALDQPADGATGVPRNVILGWKSQGDGIVYDLIYSNQPDMSEVVVIRSLEDAFCRIVLFGNRTYYWSVRASNTFEDGEWSPVWSFRTSTTTGVPDDDGTTPFTASYRDGSIVVFSHNEHHMHDEVDMRLFDALGRQISRASARFDTSPLHLSVPHLSTGMYLLDLRDSKGISQTLQVRVE